MSRICAEKCVAFPDTGLLRVIDQDFSTFGLLVSVGKLWRIVDLNRLLKLGSLVHRFLCNADNVCDIQIRGGDPI